ncbi:MAG: M50 family metallopeptidase [Minisyncoccota bacterium]
MGIIVFLGLSFVVVVHELGHFLMSKFFGVAVEEFGIGFPPRIWGKKIKETVYSLNWILWGGFLKINGLRPEVERKDLPVHTSFMRQSFYKKALIIAGGVLINFLLGWFLLFIVMIMGVPQGIFVADIKPESLAYYSGFQKGDLILNFKNADEFNNYLEQSAGKEGVFKVKRNGSEQNIPVIFPEERSKTGEILGIYYNETGTTRVGIGTGVVESFKTACGLIVSYLGGYVSLIGGLFTDSGIFQNLMSPVGLFAMGSLISKAGIVYFIQLLAYLSINLVIFNFLPFPMLDGGWFIMVLIEKIKGSSVNQKIEIIVNSFGFIILFSLLLATTIKDVINLF